MSIPSSRAFVDTTPRRSPLPQTAFDPAPLVGQVAAPVAGDDVFLPHALAQVFFQVTDQDLGNQAAVGKDDGASPHPQEAGSDVTGLLNVGTPDAQLPVHDRRVVEEQDASHPRGHRYPR